MTGFGSGEGAAAPRGKLQVELRALNHRFLEIRVRAARELAELSAHVELLARERFSRGRIEIVLRAEAMPAASPVLDVERATSAYRQLGALRDAIAPGEPVPLSLLSVVPDLFVVSEVTSEPVRDALGRAFAAAASDLDAMRAREGAALERAMRHHLGRASELLREIEGRAPEALAGAEKRLRERVARLAGSAEGTVDPARLEQEIALLADRSDIAEEIARLRSHVEQLDSMLSEAGPVGRRVEFLLQEMMREANTIGSKCADAAIARGVVALKAEVERLREQAQNIE
ncbi:MAG TPA: YicC/YloC family endoribonuclease [Polyangiaceae bacterium]|jgi:uncharacterized protein (TIGR00255 family)